MQNFRHTIVQKTIDYMLDVASHEITLQSIQHASLLQSYYDTYRDRSSVYIAHQLHLSHIQDVSRLQIKSNLVAKELQLCQTLIQELSHP